MITRWRWKLTCKDRKEMACNRREGNAGSRKVMNSDIVSLAEKGEKTSYA